MLMIYWNQSIELFAELIICKEKMTGTNQKREKQQSFSTYLIKNDLCLKAIKRSIVDQYYNYKNISNAKPIRSYKTHQINPWKLKHLINNAKSQSNLCASIKYHKNRFPRRYIALLSQEISNQ